jgi:hypothetical protein
LSFKTVSFNKTIIAYQLKILIISLIRRIDVTIKKNIVPAFTLHHMIGEQHSISEQPIIPIMIADCIITRTIILIMHFSLVSFFLI